MKLTIFGVAALGMLAAGCGGGSLGGPGRGEGSIPVGKANRGLGITSTLTSSTGLTSKSVADDSGTFYVNRLDPGTYTVSTEGKNLSPETFTIEISNNQTYIFWASDAQVGLADRVTGISIAPIGNPSFRVGESVNFRVQMTGDGNATVRPSLWLEGGVANFKNATQVLMSQAGPGVIKAKLGRHEASFEFTVEP